MTASEARQVSRENVGATVRAHREAADALILCTCKAGDYWCRLTRDHLPTTPAEERIFLDTLTADGFRVEPCTVESEAFTIHWES